MNAKLNSKKSWKLVIFVLTLITGWLYTIGCGAVAALVATATPTPTATYTPTATLTPTLTSTPTLVPSPTATYTPNPTPTPVGFFYSQKFQFKLTTPPGWKVEEQSDGIQFEDIEGNLLLMAVSVEDISYTADDILHMYITLFRDPSLKIFASSALGKKDTIELGDGTTAIRQFITGKAVDGTDLSMQITCAESGSRVYAFIFFGPSPDMQAKDDLIIDIYETISLCEENESVQILTSTHSIAGKWAGTDVGNPDTSFTTSWELTVQTGCTVGKVSANVSTPDHQCSKFRNKIGMFPAPMA